MSVSRVKLEVLTWNTQGFDLGHSAERMQHVIATIKTIKPALVYLQEITTTSHQIIEKLLVKPYFFISPDSCKSLNLAQKEPSSYYNIILISKYHFELLGPPTIYYFPTSSMGRNIITLKVCSRDDPLINGLVSTSHLESCRINADERCSQFKYWVASLAAIIGSENCQFALFGGDTNAHSDEQLTKDIILDVNLLDLAQIADTEFSDQNTWFCSKPNNGRYIKHSKNKYRFDRVYSLTKKNLNINVTQYRIIKPKYLAKLGLFVSDHAAVYCVLELECFSC